MKKFKFPSKRFIIITILCLMLISALAVLWYIFAAPTRIAFVNYQAIELGTIGRANDSRFIKITDLPVDRLAEAGDFDMVFVNGMGLRITDEQRQLLVKAAEDGTPVYTTAATNPQNDICSVDSVDIPYLSQYLSGGRANYRNLLLYVRKFIDGKKFFAPTPGDPQLSSSSLIYYPVDGDLLAFDSVAQYEQWLRDHGKWRDKAPHIILTGRMGVPDSLVARLERTGNIVYPVSVIQRFVMLGHADSVRADAVINMAHGRLGDGIVDYLRTHNIPLFAPLNVNRPYDEWMADKAGMSGGFLSQSIVTPEIDGAVLPYSLFAHYIGNDGLPHVEAIPDRLHDFVATVNNYIALRTLPNSDKKLAIFYFKGPGQNALVAEGMEVGPSLYNTLCHLRKQGYRIDGLPATAAEFERQLNLNGRVFNGYAQGRMADFVSECHPLLLDRKTYTAWAQKAFGDRMLAAIDSVDGPFPGHGMADNDGNLAIARLQYGNVVLIPQTAAGIGDDDFKMVHGTDAAPPHAYAAAYLWARYGFGADALVHYGAHGSLEFTPRRQTALGSLDWPDRLVGTMPHFYVYSTSNVGEAMIAKRRTYAGIINYLTPPFTESGLRGTYKDLSDAISRYNTLSAADRADRKAVENAARKVKKLAVGMGLHRDLRLDSVLSRPYSADDIARIERFAEELANEKITGALYVMGRPYSPAEIRSTVFAMTVDPVAHSLHKFHGGDLKARRAEAAVIVNRLIDGDKAPDDAELCRLAGITQSQLDSARHIEDAINGSKDMLSRMMVMGAMMQPQTGVPLKVADRKSAKKMTLPAGMSPEAALAMARSMGADEAAINKMKAAMQRKNMGKKNATDTPGHGGHGRTPKPEISPAEIDFATAVIELQRSLTNVHAYMQALRDSPQTELAALSNALGGGYIAPTSGGDPVLNPAVLPTGRNMFAINAEETPSAVAWEKGKALADNTIRLYRKAHNDSLPRKVSYTLWSSEFIETEGATIAQILYMLGVEPVRDPFGRVTDLRLIPEEQLGRPRIDVVVQTSGQLRDLAASRLFLVSRAVRMAAAAKDTKYPNYVSEGLVESERFLVKKGVSPKDARRLSSARVFGGLNGGYGTGIQSMVESGDRWENEREISDVYLNNMGAMYGSEEDWEQYAAHAFEAALTRTDVVVQPRQSNTWGALSLDHVYEFMGGMNLAVRNVTGKDPDAYLSDYRNRNNARMQEVKEAIGVESRTTILNPAYISGKMKGGAGDASAIADVVRNTYGWNVMKPDVIDNELWNGIYDTYIEDVNGLGVRDFFVGQNPAALQEMTAVMLETARKGMWKASDTQLHTLADLHTRLVKEHGAACSGFVCDNAKLRDFIKDKATDKAAVQSYDREVAAVRAESADANGKVMKREELNTARQTVSRISGPLVGAAVIVAVIVIMVLIRRRRKTQKND